MKAMITDDHGNIRREYATIHEEMGKLLPHVYIMLHAIPMVSERAGKQIELFKRTALILARGWSGGYVAGFCEMRSVFDGREFEYAWQHKPKGWWVVKGGRLVANDVKDPEK